MNKIAFIDLDGVVANPDARFAKAEEVRDATRNDRSIQLGERERTATDLYWQTVFTPSLVELDTVIGGINDSLMDLHDCGYSIIFLTSRPETMRDATSAWLLKNTVYDMDDVLIMKASAFQYVKTTVWKAGIIQTMATLNEYYTITDVLVIDDEQSNLNELEKYRASFRPILTTATSLEEAVLKVTGMWKEPEPFLPEA